MKKTELLHILQFVIAFIIFTSCEKVIEIDLNSSNPVLVVRGEIVKDSTTWIKLGYTSNYFTNEEMKPEEDAKVTFYDGTSSEVLTYDGNGLYKGNLITGIVGEKYRIDIEINNKHYTAESSLYRESEIYEINVKEKQSPGMSSDETRFSMKVKFRDISLGEDYYMIKLYINDVLDSYISADDKMYSKRDTIDLPLIMKSFYENDKVVVKLYSVDENTYNYYKQLNDATGGSIGPMAPATPYNPHSNFGEEVLGCFSAWSFVSDTVIVQ